MLHPTSISGSRRVAGIVRAIVSLLAAAAALAVVSCSEGVTRPRFDADALVQGDGSVDELRGRWEQWRTLGPRSYGYELYRLGNALDGPTWIEVRDGRVASARRLVSIAGVRALALGQPLPLEQFGPIDSLFAEAIRVSEAGGRLGVSYDPSFGYPARLTIGSPEVDAGVVIVVARLVAR